MYTHHSVPRENPVIYSIDRSILNGNDGSVGEIVLFRRTCYGRILKTGNDRVKEPLVLVVVVPPSQGQGLVHDSMCPVLWAVVTSIAVLYTIRRVMNVRMMSLPYEEV